MHVIPLNITEQQKEKLFKRKLETKIPVAAQIREAIDMYFKNMRDGEK